MYMQATAAVFSEGFGHESGAYLLLPGDAFYQALEQYRMITGQHHIVDMV